MKFRKKMFYMTGILTLAALFSCSPRASLILTGESDGQSFRIEKGKILEIRLNAQLGTGYSWKWVCNDKFFIEADEQDIITAEKNKTGGEDVQVFRLKALMAGETGLKFIYDRAWEKDKPAQKEFTVKVVIY